MFIIIILKIIHDAEMQKAGAVIFISEGLGYKNNKARVIFRRYMALLGNKELRLKVFGF